MGQALNELPACITEAEIDALIASHPIPVEVLRAANRDTPIRGRVKLSGVRRVPIVDPDTGRVVGFVTPHMASQGFRLGSIYVLPEARGKGLAAQMVLRFRDRGLVHFVPDLSPESHAMHRACGFEVLRRHGKGTWYKLPVVG